MKKLTLILTVFVMTSLSYGDTLQFVNHKFVYQLDKKWKVFSRNSNEAYLDIVFKRDGIKDSKGMEVIPNAVIKLIRIESSSEKDTLSPIKVFTAVALLNFAPPEVMEDFKNSRNIGPEYGLSFEQSYGFNSPYYDNFNENHTCLYFTIYDEQRYGVFLMIDSTEEIYKKIKKEIVSFIKSVKLI
jgi:hypothetical protein